ncbi:MAG: hypothetical protein ACYC9L_05660 [Sulfuricaulis sp.]
MISERHRWLLRSVDTAFDGQGHHGGFPCRLCRVKEHGEIVVSRDEREAHLSNHRREKLVREVKPQLFEDVA